jgi:hypothetical protein
MGTNVSSIMTTESNRTHPSELPISIAADYSLGLMNLLGSYRRERAATKRVRQVACCSARGARHLRGDNVNATTSDEEADMGGQSIFETNWVSLERE